MYKNNRVQILRKRFVFTYIFKRCFLFLSRPLRTFTQTNRVIHDLRRNDFADDGSATLFPSDPCVRHHNIEL